MLLETKPVLLAQNVLASACRLTAVYCLTDGYVGKQPLTTKEYCDKY